VAAEALEVAITETILAPTAKGNGTPSTRVKNGIIKIPPPSPKTAPTSPARIDIRKIDNTSKGVTTSIERVFPRKFDEPRML